MSISIDAALTLEKLTQNLTGRKWVFNTLNLYQLRQPSKRFLILLKGLGVEKSAIVAQLIQTHIDVFAYHFYQTDDTNTLKPG